ncbi:hypothetical protein [Amycolatopsis kentuckyensis]|uniref:hypothetical protein n=1 Tax=Amycolatopsis kentuckyensis TaxID=218823 RepID=UPI003569F253
MKTVKKATEIIKLLNAILFGIAIGIGALRAMRETFDTFAAEHDALSEVKNKKAAK